MPRPGEYFHELKDQNPCPKGAYIPEGIDTVNKT